MGNKQFFLLLKCPIRSTHTTHMACCGELNIFLFVKKTKIKKIFPKQIPPLVRI